MIPRTEGLRSAWNGKQGRRIRGLVVLAIAVACTIKYASFLERPYPVRDWLAWRLLRLWLHDALLACAWVSAGHSFLRRVLRVDDRPLLETVVTSAGLGAVFFGMGMYLGGAFHVYGKLFAYALPSAMVLVGGRDAFDRWRRETRDEAPFSPIAAAITLLGAVALGLLYLQVMTPDAINYDSSWSHLTIAQDYARHRGLVPFPGDYNRAVPHLASIFYTWAFLVPAENPPLQWMGALHVEFLCLLFTVAGVAAVVRFMLDEAKVRATWASFFLFPAIFVYDSNLGGAADHVLAFFVAPIFLALVRAAPTYAPRPLALLGLLLGGAMSTKYQAVYLWAGAGVVLAGAAVLRLRRAMEDPTTRRERGIASVREIGVGAAVVAGSALLASSPHFLKNLVYYGNPVYPFLQDKIASHPTHPTAPFLFEYVFKDYAWRPHGTTMQNIVDAVKLFFTFPFEPHYSFTRNVPNYGSLFTVALLLLPFLPRTRRIWVGVLVAFGALFMWGMMFRVDRHLQIFTPILAAATCATIVRAWELGIAARAGVVTLVGFSVLWSGDAAFYSGAEKLRSAVDLARSGFEGRAATRWEQRREFRAVSAALPNGSVAIIHNAHVSLGIDHDTLLDSPGLQAAIHYDGVGGPRALYDTYKRYGVTHILNQGPRQATAMRQEDVLFSAYTHRYATSTHVGGFEIIALGAPPPPDPAVYSVLVLGLSGYGDGVYPAQALSTHEQVPVEFRKYPPPPQPLAGGDLPADGLASIDAILRGSSARPGPTIQAAIPRDFEVAGTYGSFDVLVRKVPRS